MMEQRPIPGQAPLDPPDADLARAYLDELAAVADRREERVDRRALARLQLANVAVAALYIAAIGIGALLKSPPQLIALMLLLFLASTTSLIPAVGAAWRAPQWTVFGVTALAGAVVVLWDVAVAPVPAVVSVVAGIVCVALYAVAASVGGSTHER